MPIFKSTLSQLDLLKGCTRNDRRSQELLYKQYFHSLLSISRTYTISDFNAIKVLQDSFLKIFQQIELYDNQKSTLYTWMLTLLNHTSIDFLRKEKNALQAFEQGKVHDLLINAELLNQSNNSDAIASWEEMKKILDREMPESENKKKGLSSWGFWSYFSVLYLTVFGILVSYYVHKKNGNSKPVTDNIIIEKTALQNNLKECYTIKNRNYFIHLPELLSKQNNPGSNTITYIISKKKKKSLVPETLDVDRKFQNDRENITTASNSPVNSSIIHSILPYNMLGTTKFTLLDSASQNRIVQSVQIPEIKDQKVKGFILGAAFNFNLPVSRQEMSTVNIKGTANVLFDYMPAIYLQYHFSKKLYIQSELQFINPQYTPNLMLFHHVTSMSPIKRQADTVTLNKLYYMNLPLSLHFSPVKNLYIGTGLQYSYLSRSILSNEQAIWEKGAAGWKKTADSKTIVVRSNPNAEANKANAGNNRSGNGNGNGNPANINLMTPVDTVAQSFKSNDWRFLIDASYQWHRFNLGLRFNIGIDNYIDTYNGTSNTQIKDRNESFLLYLKYNFLDWRSKKAVNKTAALKK